MENTLENKSKFFAQYWGQEVIQFMSCGEGIITFDVSDMNFNGFDGKEWLFLKPLSLITDEDAMRVGFINRWDFEFYLESMGFNKIADRFSSVRIDFLRSKGYALPYMGLSVEEQISFGWVKLKSAIDNAESK